MAMITGAFLFIASVITAALSTLLAEEIKAWSPWIIRRIISFSVARLPENLRERFGEEWESHVGEVPGEVGKLLTSVGFLLAVPGMTLSIRREEFVGRMQRNLDQMDHLFLTATSVVNTIQADSFLLSVKDVTDPMDRLVRHLGTMEG
jgi:hypothetical protein